MEPINPAQGWNGDSPVFERLITMAKPSVILEIGSWHGQSAITMAHACKKLGLETTIYCIDTWLGAVEFHTHPTPERDLMLKDGYPQVYYKFIENITAAGVRDMIKPVPLPSDLAHQIVPNADLIYIDGDHSYESVKRDIANYLPKLNRGGIMFGDDYTNSVFPGVRKAVDEHLHEVLDNWFWLLR